MNLSHDHWVMLKKIGSAGIKKVKLSLSTMLKKKINITKPEIKMIPINRINHYLGPADQPYCCIYLTLMGKESSSMVLLFSLTDTFKILKLLFANCNTSLHLTELEQSALKEIANILTGSYLTALTHFTGHFLTCSVPYLSIDMLGALLSDIVLNMQQTDELLLIKNHLIIEENAVQGYLLFFPNTNDLHLILAEFKDNI